jgi:hypothetical protein
MPARPETRLVPVANAATANTIAKGSSREIFLCEEYFHIWIAFASIVERSYPLPGSKIIPPSAWI